MSISKGGMMLRLPSTLTYLASLVLAASGCSIVSDGHLKSFDGGGGTRDGEMPGADAGPRFDDVCGANPPAMMITDTTRGIQIDTTSYRSRNGSSCGDVTPGNDVFIGVQVVATELWHFHLTALSAGRQPMLYLTQRDRCDSRTCQFVSNACAGSGEEHFAFVAESDDLWFIGIDDNAQGGGQYVLDVFRPVCGDGDPAHGESCDDGNRVDGDGCDRNCRIELSEARSDERMFEPNDNRVEANALRIPASNELQITGTIGGPGACLYPDVFAVDMPSGSDLQVDMLNSDGTPCASGATTPFQLVLQSADGDPRATNMTDGSGCATIRANDLDGTYFIFVQVPAETSEMIPYRMRVRRVP